MTTLLRMPPTELESGHFVMLQDLVSRSDLNLRTGRVLSKSWTEAAQHPGRVPVEMVTVKVSPGKKDSPKVQIWVKLDNLEGPILDVAAMTAPPYNAMTPEERTEASLRMRKPPPRQSSDACRPPESVSTGSRQSRPRWKMSSWR